jgi:predicted nucleotidyltransferase component of viral defense system
LLQTLSKRKELTQFGLGGGTGLALQIGHRISVDLDFFTSESFDSQELIRSLDKSFKINQITYNINTVNCFISQDGINIKVDFLKHGYAMLKPLKKESEMRLFSLQDISAMKLNAIANRGAKKDFYDIYSLLDHFSLSEMIKFFELKYPAINSFSVVKSLLYFEDANLDPDPISLLSINWADVKEKINHSVNL